MYGNTVQIYMSKRKTGRHKGQESAFVVCVRGQADGFLSYLRVLSPATFSRCAWTRWCTQWHVSSFPGLCASVSIKL